MTECWQCVSELRKWLSHAALHLRFDSARLLQRKDTSMHQHASRILQALSGVHFNGTSCWASHFCLLLLIAAPQAGLHIRHASELYYESSKSIAQSEK